jgi:hypothetical protein
LAKKIAFLFPYATTYVVNEKQKKTPKSGMLIHFKGCRLPKVARCLIFKYFVAKNVKNSEVVNMQACPSVQGLSYLCDFQ